MKYIYHHLGLGDHIICNGLVRYLIEVDEEYTLFVKPHNLGSVSFMYRDVSNLKLLSSDDDFVLGFLKSQSDSDKIIIGFKTIGEYSWDEFFYVQHNVDFRERWLSFKVERDLNREMTLFQELNPSNDEYILIHNSGSDGTDRINYDIINPEIKKIFVENKTNNIFDYLGLAEKAKEIHCVDSSFKHLVDSFNFNGELYYHTLTKNRGPEHQSKNNWILV